MVNSKNAPFGGGRMPLMVAGECNPRLLKVALIVENSSINAFLNAGDRSNDNSLQMRIEKT